MSTRLKFNSTVHHIFRPIIKPLKISVETRSAKYDMGVNHDPIHSFADLFTRYLYARLYQKETFNLSWQVIRQYLCVTPLFYFRRLIRKTGLGPIPVRVIFLAGDPLDWGSLDSIYRECKSNKDFVVHVINIGMTWMGERTDCANLFDQDGVACHDGINQRILLDTLYPDVIFSSSPYDELRPSCYETKELLRYAKICYVPYGIDFSDGSGVLSKQTFGYPIQRNAWRIFTRSSATLESYRKYAGKGKSSVMPLGLPVMDHYHQQSIESLSPDYAERTKDKFKIIYAPHHTIDGWSTFLEYAGCIRDYINQHDDCFLIFRPHPCLMGTLMHRKIMTEHEFRDFFSGDRVYFSEDVDFNKVFRHSDMLISDASSFLVQYAPTGNPIIYLEKVNGWGLESSISRAIDNSCYVARSSEDIVLYISQLKSGLDVMKNQRILTQEDMCRGIFSGGAGKRIANYLLESLA